MVDNIEVMITPRGMWWNQFVHRWLTEEKCCLFGIISSDKAAEESCDHVHDADEWTFGSGWVSWLCDKKETEKENGGKSAANK